MNNNTSLQDLRSILVSYGYQITTLPVPDGEIHRMYEYGGKPGNLNAWYWCNNSSILYAVFGCWRTGDVFRWCATDPKKLTPAQRKEFQQKMAEAIRSAEVAREASQYVASWRAGKILSKSRPADNAHPYLARKGVLPHGLQQKGDALIMPFYANGKLTTLQFIYPDGTKKWLSGGKKKTASYLIGTVGDIVCIAEGYATGASIYQSKGYATFIAGDAGNLRWVAESVKYAFPHVKIIVCADNDDTTPGNPGVKKAKEAAAAVGGLLAIAAGDCNA